MKKIGTVLAVAALAVGAMATQAMAGIEQPSISVDYTGLDLTRSADTQLLYRRLKQAAANVCGALPSIGLGAREHYQACYRTTLDNAVMQVHSPQLLALHRAAYMHPTSFES